MGGWVATETLDHTSALRLLERFTGVAEPNLSAWRRKTFGDFTSAFRFSEGRKSSPRLPGGTAAQLQKAQKEVATLPAPRLPGANQTFPHQEQGHRPQV